MNNKTTYVGIIVTLLIAIGGYFYPKYQTNLVSAVSSSGVYSNAVGQSLIVFSPTTANGTSTSILNSGASDRAVTSINAYCSTIGTSLTYLTGAGLINWSLLAATTSVANQGLQGSVDYVANLTISTSSTSYYIATSTEPFPQYAGRVWPVSTYLTFNTNATNTATCTYSANWIAL